MAEAAGVPSSSLPAMDGRSITRLLRGAPALGREEIFWHFPHYSPQLGKPSAAIRRGNDKLLLFFEDNRVELYDLKEDIGETKDLASARPAKAAELRRRLEAWLRDTGAQLPAPNPKHDLLREREAGAPSGPTTAK
jgi:arylsulfatase A-like enzyme